MNLSVEEAFKIADTELKKSYYKKQLEHGWIYSLLDFELDYKEIIDDGKEAYYIYVVGGTFCARRDPDYKISGIGIISKLKNIDGEFDKDSDIKCIVYKKTGKYQYLKD